MKCVVCVQCSLTLIHLRFTLFSFVHSQYQWNITLSICLLHANFEYTKSNYEKKTSFIKDKFIVFIPKNQGNKNRLSSLFILLFIMQFLFCFLFWKIFKYIYSLHYLLFNENTQLSWTYYYGLMFHLNLSTISLTSPFLK